MTTATHTEPLSLYALRTAHQRALQKLQRQQQAIVATQAEVAIWEKEIANAQGAGAPTAGKRS